VPGARAAPAAAVHAAAAPVLAGACVSGEAAATAAPRERPRASPSAAPPTTRTPCDPEACPGRETMCAGRTAAHGRLKTRAQGMPAASGRPAACCPSRVGPSAGAALIKLPLLLLSQQPRHGQAPTSWAAVLRTHRPVVAVRRQKHQTPSRPRSSASPTNRRKQGQPVDADHNAPTLQHEPDPSVRGHWLCKSGVRLEASLTMSFTAGSNQTPRRVLTCWRSPTVWGDPHSHTKVHCATAEYGTLSLAASKRH